MPAITETTEPYEILVRYESGEFKGMCGAGEATLIPRGERHWCENRSDKPCRLVCVMLK